MKCSLSDPYIALSYCRYNILTGCPQAKTCTLILRGGAEQFIEETERSLHDAIMIVRRTIKNDSVVAGEQLLPCLGDNCELASELMRFFFD